MAKKKRLIMSRFGAPFRGAADSASLRRRATALVNNVVAEARTSGTIDPTALTHLTQLKELLTIEREITPHRITLAPFAVVAITGAAVLILGAIKVSEPTADIHVRTQKVDFVIGDDATPTAGLFGDKVRWARTTRWRSAEVPGPAGDIAAKPPSGARLLSVTAPDASPEPIFVGIGDTTPLTPGTEISYGLCSENSLTLTTASTPLQLPIAVIDGMLRVSQTGEKTISFEYPLADVIKINTSHLTFASDVAIGPLSVRALHFDNSELVGDNHAVALSTIDSATVDFPSSPNAKTVLTPGDRLELVPTERGATVYIQPQKSQIEVVVRGRFSKIEAVGRDVRPSWLDVFAGSPRLQLLAGSFSGLIVMLAAVFRWLGFRV